MFIDKFPRPTCYDFTTAISMRLCWTWTRCSTSTFQEFPRNRYGFETLMGSDGVEDRKHQQTQGVLHSDQGKNSKEGFFLILSKRFTKFHWQMIKVRESVLLVFTICHSRYQILIHTQPLDASFEGFLLVPF